MLNIVLITGISGSGKSVALRQLEDDHYTCVDNLPVNFLNEFIANAREENLQKVAIAIDIRSTGQLDNLPEVITSIRSMGTHLQVIFLDSNTATLMQRYNESRRRHPISIKLQAQGKSTKSLEECIEEERELLSPLREQEYVIDTSSLQPGQLRHWIHDLTSIEDNKVLLTFESFAFKRGVPNDADLVFDVRCLPNPHYDKECRPLNGRDEPVQKWLKQFQQVDDLINDISQYIRKWLPHYLHDTRSYLTVAIGCTGGQHRSVYVAEALAQKFSDHTPLRVRHRTILPSQNN